KMCTGKQAHHLIHHPLSSLQDRIEAGEVIISDADGTDRHFGAHIHGVGGVLVKGENLQMRARIVDGKEMTELDFKVNHAFRLALEKAIEELKGIKPKDLQELAYLSGSHITSITVENVSNDEYEQHKIVMQGLGTIFVG